MEYREQVGNLNNEPREAGKRQRKKKLINNTWRFIYYPQNKQRSGKIRHLTYKRVTLAAKHRYQIYICVCVWWLKGLELKRSQRKSGKGC